MTSCGSLRRVRALLTAAEHLSHPFPLPATLIIIVMELSNTQLEALNWLLPPGFVVEQASLTESRPKRTETERLRTDLRFLPPAQTQVSRPEKEPSSHKPQRSEGFRKVFGILQKLKSHASIGPFLQPVDRNKIPDYYDIIHCPVDLSLVEKRLLSDFYPSSKEFAADIRKMWSNSFLYNTRGTDIYIATIELSAYFENLIKGNEDIPLKAVQADDSPVQKASSREPAHFSESKRKQLGARINMLQPKFFKGVYDLVKDSTGAGHNGDEFQFDIELLPDDVCYRLEEYTDRCLAEARGVATLPQPGVNSLEKEDSEDSDSSDSEDFLEVPDAEEDSKTQAEAIEVQDKAWNACEQPF